MRLQGKVAIVTGAGSGFGEGIARRFAEASPAGVALVALDGLLADAHVISLNCPLTRETRHLVSRASLAKMREGVILVNTARGALVDDGALLEAIASGKVRAAGLDAFTTEPLVGDHPYRNAANVVLSPHVAGVSEDAYVKMGTAAARNVLDVLAAERVA